MAMQTQYALLPDFQTIRDHQINSFVGQQQQHTVNGAVLSDPKSGLTCNNASASGSRKRNRDTAATNTAAAIQQFQFSNPSKFPKTATTTTIAISNNNQETAYQQNRLLGSSGTSISGRLVSQHFTEIDTLIHLHNAELRSGLGEIQKRHRTQLLQILEAQASKKITEKDAEIEGLKRKQAELEARLKQAAAENQIWFTAARNGEALVTGLRASLDQALRCGDGGCHVAAGQAEDAESCCGGGDTDDRKPLCCRACRERDVSVLLLPCRHLSLCLECEPAVDACPICYEKKNVGLQVFME